MAKSVVQPSAPQVFVFTAHRDPSHCFEETIDGTLDVHVHGEYVPRRVLGGASSALSIDTNCVTNNDNSPIME